MVTLWQNKWYFPWYGAMVTGVPIRYTPTLPVKDIERGEMWDALELVKDDNPLTSVTIR